MRRGTLNILFLLLPVLLIGQNNQKIEGIQKYIEEVTVGTNFISDTEQGKVSDSTHGGDTYTKTFYALDENELFSVFYQEYGLGYLQKMFYYKDNQLIAVIIEYADKTKSTVSKLETAQTQYFFEKNILLNTEELDELFPPDVVLKEGKDFIADYFRL